LIHFVLLTGGTGSRMKSDVPKQFMELRGVPVMEFSLRAFCGLPEHLRGGLVLVSHPDLISRAESISANYRPHLSFVHIVNGGATRHVSSKNGLSALKQELTEEDIVLIHDGARPLVTPQEMLRLAARLEENKMAACATLAAPATETLAVAPSMDGEIQNVPDRSTLFAIKTPQAIQGKYVGRFLASPGDHYTDLISWCLDEKLGAIMAPASESNIKLTHPGDLPMLESLLDR